MAGREPRGTTERGGPGGRGGGRGGARGRGGGVSPERQDVPGGSPPPSGPRAPSQPAASPSAGPSPLGGPPLSAETPQRPSPKLTMPAPGSRTHLPPGIGSRRPSFAAISDGSGSPNHSPSPTQGSFHLPGGSTVNNPDWLSLKNPDLLSADSRVLHHNQAQLAIRLDQFMGAFTRFAANRAGKKEVDTETAETDKNTAIELDKEEYTGVFREQLNTLKENLGKLTVTKGQPAITQANAFLELLAQAAAQQQQDKDAAMDTGEPDDQQRPDLGRIHALASSLSEPGLRDWTMTLIKNLGLGPERVTRPGKKAKAAQSGGNDGGEETSTAGKKRSRRSAGESGTQSKKQKRKEAAANEDDEIEGSGGDDEGEASDD